MPLVHHSANSLDVGWWAEAKQRVAGGPMGTAWPMGTASGGGGKPACTVRCKPPTLKGRPEGRGCGGGRAPTQLLSSPRTGYPSAAGRAGWGQAGGGEQASLLHTGRGGQGTATRTRYGLCEGQQVAHLAVGSLGITDITFPACAAARRYGLLPTICMSPWRVPWERRSCTCRPGVCILACLDTAWSAGAVRSCVACSKTSWLRTTASIGPRQERQGRGAVLPPPGAGIWGVGNKQLRCRARWRLTRLALHGTQQPVV